MPEIGGYFGLERYRGSLYHDGAVALNCGRSCLAYLVELRGIDQVWLPDYLCASVARACGRIGCETASYRIGRDLSFEVPHASGAGDWLYLVDYFGQLGGRELDRALDAFDGRVVIDESQAFFRTPPDGVDALYSCRKFFGVADGAFLRTGDGRRLARPLPKSRSWADMDHVLGRAEMGSSAFLPRARENDARFSDAEIEEMSVITESLLRAVDYGAARLSREENWKTLHATLGHANLLDLRESEGPYAYPLLLAYDATPVRERLAKRGIFVPLLWPGVASSSARLLSASILPLPVDHRYGAEEMDYVAVETLAALEGRLP